MKEIKLSFTYFLVAALRSGYLVRKIFNQRALINPSPCDNPHFKGLLWTNYKSPGFPVGKKLSSR